jgi:hypothetical protein
LTLTAASPVSVNVHVFVLFPLLEQAPDQTASRPFDTLSVMAVPVANVADPALPIATRSPAGCDDTDAPSRPLAVTVSVAVWPGGVIVRTALRVAPPNAPPIVAGVEAVTDPVVTVNVALVAPDATVTLAGTVATVLLLVSETTAPPVGAAPVRVTVPRDAVPPTTLAGLTESADTAAACGGAEIVNTALRVVPPEAPLIVTVVGAPTAAVATVKDAPVAPAGTVMLPGVTAADVLLLASATATPPLGAAPVSVAVPWTLPPPTTLVGLSAIEESAGVDGVTVNVADFVTPPPDTEIVTTVCTVTAEVKTLNPPRSVPAGIWTPAGTEATAGLLLVRVSVSPGPPNGRGDAMTTRPEELPPNPTVEVEVRVNDMGGCCGVNVTGAVAMTPFQLAVTVAVVFSETLVVGIGNDADQLPGATNSDAGGPTAGELLDSVTEAPPAGACPVNMTRPPGCAPPLIVLGEIDSD